MMTIRNSNKEKAMRNKTIKKMKIKLRKKMMKEMGKYNKRKRC